MTLNKFMYIIIHPYFHDKIRIKYSKTEDVNEIEEIQHPLVRECLKLVGIKKGIEIASIADVPAGTGLGSSSSFTVGLLHALYTYKGKPTSKEKLAQDACKIEIELLGEPIGKQDQYAASYGGLNHIQFHQNGTVIVEPIRCKSEIVEDLERNLLMFYIGNEREASQILKEQKENMHLKEKLEIVRKQAKLAGCLKEVLQKGRFNRFGEILREGWSLKKQIASTISNPKIDEYYDKAIRAGALGGKLLGAGGGGFLLFYCKQKDHGKVRMALGLRELDFKFSDDGSKIIYFEK